MTPKAPSYIELHESGGLRERAEYAKGILASCTLCPRNCGVNRISGETGVCKTGDKARVSSFNPHFGEEPPLVGRGGSGTIFFTHCNLLCLFCQNFDISHEGEGETLSDETLAAMMLRLQKMGCHNINFVTPTHVVPQILSALEIAVEKGLSVPLVYNSGGYDSVETLKLLDGAIDIYMPDFKFMNRELAKSVCNAEDYSDIACAALKEMHRQVGDLVIDETGIARKGLLVRHLVLPRGLADTEAVMTFLAEEISRDTYVNIMPQYRPCGRAREIDGLSEYPSKNDFEQASDAASRAGLHRLDKPKRVFMVC